jgi:hypothetical protein
MHIGETAPIAQEIIPAGAGVNLNSVTPLPAALTDFGKLVYSPKARPNNRPRWRDRRDIHLGNRRRIRLELLPSHAEGAQL